MNDLEVINAERGSEVTATLEVRGHLAPDLPHADYHRRELGVASKTALDQLARSPAHYRAFIEGADKDTPAMAFGRLLHSYVLETATCLERVALEPDFGDCRYKINRERRDVWRAENEGREVVDRDTWDKCRRMGDAVHKHPIAVRLLSLAATEVSAFWTDAETGIECKMRVDGWIESRRLALDLKTTEDASPVAFARSVHGYRYHVQDAFYSDGLEAVTGSPTKGFVFIAVEKAEPWAVATYMLDDQARERGRELYRRDLATLKRCIENDEWPAYGHELQTLSLSAYQLRD